MQGKPLFTTVSRKDERLVLQSTAYCTHIYQTSSRRIVVGKTCNNESEGTATKAILGWFL
ncbi:hypothetical protein SAMD00079811_33530 [Scytonema sp. HK-05]|uniref:hypothetical protein n=1 Tax=Scytonema sp. HK-05 TaxID=1137095 RepID=UPI000A735F7F|nr:hypothetical protein [Scytonema sp. HK-05]BAY45746.1 hypothetical protein SAMD00079811_33530 [Scytonema sp. HK-05]